jgi:hypothetical protein
MWPRVIEGMLGAWMLVVPFVFRGTASLDDYTTNAFVSGAIHIVTSVLCFWEPTRLARIVTLGVSIWLALHGYFGADRPGPPAAQNELMVGLTLLVFAIIPNETSLPPRPWRVNGAQSSARQRP